MTRPRPESTFEADVDDDQVTFFREHGYLVVDRITSDEELAWLGEVFDEIFSTRDTGIPGGIFDVARPYDSQGSDAFTQALFPEFGHPELRATQYVRNGRRIASRLLGLPEADLQHWGHMLSKPPQHGAAAPWHQDEAYWDPRHEYHAVGAWLPLDDVDEDNGCLWFLPGSHRSEVRPHRHLGDDPAVHLLELVDPVDTSAAVSIPLSAGGASFHHPRLLHHSRPNTTDRPRRAYANEFQTVPVRRDTQADRPWIDEGREAFEARTVFQAR